MRAPTPFEAALYAWVARIPRGRVCTYAELARAAGCGSPRAVGQALRRNPYAPAVPCHRVIASSLTPGGFQGHAQGPRMVRKMALLAEEGVLFTAGRLADPSRLYHFKGMPGSGESRTGS